MKFHSNFRDSIENAPIYQQLVNAIDLLIKENLVLYEAKSRFDDEVAVEKERRIEDIKKSILTIITSISRSSE